MSANHKTVVLTRDFPDAVKSAGGSTFNEICERLAAEAAGQSRRSNEASVAGKVHKQLPKRLAQVTFREARNFCFAIADGASLRRWQEIPGEVALRHKVENEPLEVKLSVGQSLLGLGANVTYEGLRQELMQHEAESVLLFLIVLGLALQEPHIQVELDYLLRLLGWSPHSQQERQEMRRKVFRWLTVFDSMTVHGRRSGSYKDPETQEVLDLSISGKLIALNVEEREVLTFNQTPLAVTITGGSFVEKFRGNRQVLQDIGNVLRLTDLPTGKPSGAWALGIGMALNQLWREQASRAKVSQAGDNNHLTAQFDHPFTRFQLLDMFRSEPSVEKILASSNPKRAQKYWNEAIRRLKQCGLIAHCAELDKSTKNRSGWKEFWLNRQRLDIRPKGDSLSDVVEIARSGKKFRRKTQKKGKK